MIGVFNQSLLELYFGFKQYLLFSKKMHSREVFSSIIHWKANCFSETPVLIHAYDIKSAQKNLCLPFILEIVRLRMFIFKFSGYKRRTLLILSKRLFQFFPSYICFGTNSDDKEAKQYQMSSGIDFVKVEFRHTCRRVQGSKFKLVYFIPVMLRCYHCSGILFAILPRY